MAMTRTPPTTAVIRPELLLRSRTNPDDAGCPAAPSGTRVADARPATGGGFSAGAEPCGTTELLCGPTEPAGATAADNLGVGVVDAVGAFVGCVVGVAALATVTAGPHSDAG